MKVIGKVGDQTTYLDTSSMKGNCLLAYSKIINIFYIIFINSLLLFLN